ncbi:putative nuclease HARBI1 [Salvia splendens]|uniref:putative nuclease HARBI1 n=1 Tax=Salvia splendens TaxID=180675 RepID=UPI001C264D15|nr:putative nuclease HARBI1 [Salvia splendens]
MHNVLGGVLKLHETLFVQPEPVPDNCTDHRWKWFKGAVGALDGTYINVRVPIEDQPRFCSRKGQISTNTLAACDRFLRFTYVLPGWEGSAGDSRVLRDAVSRPHGLRVPIGTYYLCDNAHANSEGFLTPYKGVRYYLKEWGPAAHVPQNPKELFNMRHTKARNIIERAFAILKMRWGILRSPSFYPLQVQIRLITCCFILHNFIRREMDDDPIENQLDTELGEFAEGEELGENLDYVDSIDPTDAWTNKRRDLSLHMWNNRDGH